MLRPVRAYRERQRPAPHHAPYGRGDNRNGEFGGHHREILLALAGGHRLLAGPLALGRRNEVGDNYLCLHTLSDPEDLPSGVATDCRYERLSTDRSDCRLSFAAPIGILLTCNHVVNQYLFIDDSAENLRKFEQTARNMHSLSRYSRSNQINREWIEEYLNEAHSKGLTSIRAQLQCHGVER